MRSGLVVLGMLLCWVTPAAAQVSIGIGLPGVSIGINLPVYPELVPVPGYPVYYAPRVNSNYFFYDGMYWVYQRDNWYASTWYNGPWGGVAPEAVPLFVLRVPVRYYRQPPEYFRGWRADAPPRWGEHWGNSWEERRPGWDKWDRRAAPRPAPLPAYQRQYSGSRYPQAAQQQALQSQRYRYQPRDAEVQQHNQAQREQGAHESPPPSPAQARHNTPPAAGGPAPQRGGGDDRRPAAAQPSPPQPVPTAQLQRQPPQQGAAQHDQGGQRSQGQDNAPQGKGPPHDSGPGHDQGHERGEERGGGNNK
jgi:hypothetical protein